jgi:PilZ domain
MLQDRQTLASHLFDVERRKSDRSDVAIQTCIQRRNRELIHIHISNISQTGVMGRCEAPFAERDLVKIDIPGLGWVTAQVVWAMNDQYGFNFDRQLEWLFVDTLWRMHHPST